MSIAICLVACDNETYYTIMFDSDGGTEVDSQYVVSGQKATKPNDPVLEGYTFDGWYIDGEQWSFVGYVVTEDITLVAKWVEVSTEGLIYTRSSVSSYELSGIGVAEDADIVIASTYEGLPVTSIGDYAFDECSNIKSVVIPNTVTSIGGWAFRRCTSLRTVVIPDSVTIIGISSFYKCSSLSSIDIPNSVTSIGVFAFYECISLETLVIPDSVISIGGRAFADCSRLTSVTIPESVISIGESAFDGCVVLISVVFKDTDTWYYTTSSSYSGGSVVSVANTSDVATLLKNTYSSYYWYKVD